jgi:1,4-alpha-glucan branching enzyme
VAAARLWYAANVGAAGLPMMFMGTEFAQSGWWNTDEWHRLNWECAADEIGRGMMAAVWDVNLLRKKFPALRYGWSNCIHEDRMNGIMG